MSWTVGILGCGRMGRRHARAFSQDPRFHLAAALDPDKRRLEDFRVEWKIPTGFDRLEELLSGGPPEVISLCSPSDLHFPQIRQILAGARRPRLLFVEKPICLTAEELAGIQRWTGQTGVPIVVNHTRRFDPAHRRLAEWTRSNRFGSLLEGFCTYYGGWVNNGTHWVDLLRMLFPQQPRILSSQSTGWGRGSDADLQIELQVGEAPVHLQAVDEKRYQIFEAELRFERGRVRILDFGKRIELEEAQINAHGERILVPVEGSPWRGLEFSMPAAVEAVAAALEGGQGRLAALGVGLEEAAHSMRIVWAAQEMAMVTHG